MPPIKVRVRINECGTIPMEVDTGALMSIKSEVTYRSVWPGRRLDDSNVKIQTYSRKTLLVVGGTKVRVCYESQTADLSLVVVKGDDPTLLGRN